MVRGSKFGNLSVGRTWFARFVPPPGISTRSITATSISHCFQHITLQCIAQHILDAYVFIQLLISFFDPLLYFRTRTHSHRKSTIIMGILERIKEIEDEMARTQKNKATNYHLGTLKAKLAKLRNDLLVEQSGGGGGAGAGEGFDVARLGDARVALIGFPSVGKSSLLNQLTGTQSEAVSKTTRLLGKHPLPKFFIHISTKPY